MLLFFSPALLSLASLATSFPSCVCDTIPPYAATFHDLLVSQAGDLIACFISCRPLPVRSHANLYCYYRRHETFIVRYWVHQLDFLRHRYCPLSISRTVRVVRFHQCILLSFFFGFDACRLATLISHGISYAGQFRLLMDTTCQTENNIQIIKITK